MRLWTQLKTFASPSLPEPIEPRQIRRVEKLACWLPLFLTAANFGLLLNPDVDRVSVTKFLWWNVPSHAVLVLTNLAALRWARTPAHHRRALAVSIVALHWGNMTGMTLSDAVSLNGAFMCINILFCRLMLDATLGLWSFASAATMTIAVFVFRGLHLVPELRFLLNARLTNPSPGTLAVICLWVVLIEVLAWMVASYVANRFRSLTHQIVQERLASRRRVAEALAQAGQGRLVGSVLAGRYHLRELLGRGGMGEVYEAVRVSDSEPVAVKVLHPHLAEMPTFMERFRREAVAAEKISERYAPKILEVGQDGDGTPFIVMERLHGEDLATLLRRVGQLPLDIVMAIATQIAEALDAAHASGVVHRDLKPQNVFLLAGKTPPEIRLLDFGIARVRTEAHGETLTSDSVILGTPGFMAPEQARGAHAEIGAHTDVFALGGIVYRALTGQAAFSSRNPAEAIFEVLNRNPTPPTQIVPGLPPLIDVPIRLALAKSPQERYATATAFTNDLALAVRGQLAPDVAARAAALDIAPDPFLATEAIGGTPSRR
jgi:serine/threonine-protein kinase